MNYAPHTHNPPGSEASCSDCQEYIAWLNKIENKEVVCRKCIEQAHAVDLSRRVHGCVCLCHEPLVDCKNCGHFTTRDPRGLCVFCILGTNRDGESDEAPGIGDS